MATVGGVIARTRLAVLQAAAAELVEHGIAAADTDRIARAAGVDAADISAAWPQRDLLLQDAVRAALRGDGTGLRGEPRAALMASLEHAAAGDGRWAAVLAEVAAQQ